MVSIRGMAVNTEASQLTAVAQSELNLVPRSQLVCTLYTMQTLHTSPYVLIT